MIRDWTPRLEGNPETVWAIERLRICIDTRRRKFTTLAR